MKKIITLLHSKYTPIIFLCILWAVFSSPFLFQNKVLFPSDYLVSNFSPWSAYPEYFSAVKNDSMPDVITQIYPWRVFAMESFKDLQVPLWNPYSFSGTPFLANYQSAVFSPLNLGFLFFSFINWWTFLIVLQPLLAGIFTYLYARSIKLDKTSSIVSSVSFMFCGFITSWMTYGTLAYAFLYFPLALFASEKYFMQKQSRYLLLLFITIPLSFFSGHFQISLYFFIFLLFYIFFKLLVYKDIKASVTEALAVFFGILIASLQLFPSIEIYLQSVRSTIFQKVEVIPWGYIPTLLAPDFFGNPVTRNAWYGHYAEWNMYVGIITVFFAVYALFWIKKNIVLFFAISALVSLLLCFQSFLLDAFVYVKIPVLSTSALSRIVVVFSFSLCLLAGIGINKFTDEVKKNKHTHIIIVSVLFVLLFAVLWVISFTGIFISSEHTAVASSNLRFPSIIFVAFMATVGFVCFTKYKSKLLVFSVLIMILLSFDMLRFSLKWVPYEPKSSVYPNAPVTREYGVISGHDRVFGNFGAENTVYYKLPSLEGYDAVYIRRYGQFISYLDKGIMSESSRSGVDLPLQGKYMLKGANFLGIKYFVHKITDGQNVWEFPFWKYDPVSVKLLYDDKKFQVLENTNAFPRAFLVSNVIVEKDEVNLLDRMFDAKTDLRTTAFIEEKGRQRLSSGSAEIISYKPNTINVKTNAKGNSFMVLTDSFYPGWNAYIGSKKLKIYRTDFAFRGVYVPKGISNITFVYNPPSLRYGAYVAIIGLLGICALCVVVRNRKK